MKRILIVGSGYVGLVTGVCFAEVGHHVICLDIDQKKIDALQRGIVPFYEPLLSELMSKNQAAGRLKFTSDYALGVAHSQICFIAVPTPCNEDGSCNIGYVLSAAGSIAEVMQEPKLIVNKSTVPMGTAERVLLHMQERLRQRGAHLKVDVASNPEFLKEGAAINDCMHPDRVIIGASSERACTTLKEVYAPFGLKPNQILIMDPRSSEMSKYAANAMLAARISLMNEFALLAEKVGANIHSVRLSIGSDRRIGEHFLLAGIGYGGSCFPKDVSALIEMGKGQGEPMELLLAVERVNTRQKGVLFQKMQHHFEERGGLADKTIAIWGLSFKPETDDMREAPSLVLIRSLLQAGAHLRLYDPVAMDQAQACLPRGTNITWCQNPYDAAKGAHAAALVTEWKEFQSLDLDHIAKLLVEPTLFDGRNLFVQTELLKRGFTYYGIGVPHESAHHDATL